MRSERVVPISTLWNQADRSQAPGQRIATHPWVAVLLRLIAAAIIVSAAAVQGYVWLRADAVQTNPRVAPVNVDAILFPVAHYTVLVDAGHEFAPWRTTREEIVSSVELWRRMHLSHWNSVPDDLRGRGLDNMLARYRAELVSPQRWDAMTAADWDRIPQPVRTVAYRHMIDYWSGFYALGAIYAIPSHVAADTLAAVLMSESWFDHRARVVNAGGNQDIGLAQASDYARRRLRELHAAGAVDAAFDDPDYYNPWVATRFAAIWMKLLLDEAEGNLDTAVRAYHRGIAAAYDPRGTAYLQTVHQRLSRYIRNVDAPVAWSFVWHRARLLAHEDWPWLRRSSLPR